MANSYELTKVLVDINCLRDGLPSPGQRRGRLGSCFMGDWLSLSTLRKRRVKTLLAFYFPTECSF